MSIQESVSVPVQFSKESVIRQPVNLFENQRLPRVSEDDSIGLLTDLQELERQGLDGVVHLVFRGTLTGLSVENSIPQNVKNQNLYQQLHILSPHDRIDPLHKLYIDTHPDNVVYVNEDGTISSEMQNRLATHLDHKVGIILGGGPGHPQEKIYTPVIKAVEAQAKQGTPLTGICLGHQLINEMNSPVTNSANFDQGSFEIGSQVEQITPEGQLHPIFQDMGNSVVVVHVNEYRSTYIDVDNAIVLTLNAEGKPSAQILSLAMEGQALTWQAHPEFPMKGIIDERSFEISGISVKISQNTSIPYAGLVQYYLASEERLQKFTKEYGLQPGNIQELLDPQRLKDHSGPLFYHRILKYMAKFQLQHQSGS